jgi:hypothetical protein
MEIGNAGRDARDYVAYARYAQRPGVGGLFLDKDLVSVDNGQVVFGHVISRLAESLSPLGAAARIFAKSCAYITEMCRLNLEGRRIEADKAERLVNLEDRRVAVAATLRSMHTRVGHAELNARGLRRCIDNMQRTLVKPNVPLEDKQLCLEAL